MLDMRKLQFYSLNSNIVVNPQALFFPTLHSVHNSRGVISEDWILMCSVSVLNPHCECNTTLNFKYSLGLHTSNDIDVVKERQHLLHTWKLWVSKPCHWHKNVPKPVISSLWDESKGWASDYIMLPSYWQVLAWLDNVKITTFVCLLYTFFFASWQDLLSLPRHSLLFRVLRI